MGSCLNAYIYGIRCHTTGGLYIGSSVEPMDLRLRKHVTDLRGYLGINKKWRNYRTSFEVIMNDNYTMFVIEEYPCDSKIELERREGLHILNYGPAGCVNKRIPRKMEYTQEDLDSLPSLT